MRDIKKQRLKAVLGIALSTIILFFVIESVFQSSGVIVLLIRTPVNVFTSWHLYIGILHIASLGLSIWLINVFGNLLTKNLKVFIKIIKKDSKRRKLK